MRVLVISNINSGFKDAAIYDFVRALAEDGMEVVMRFTDGKTLAESYLDDAIEFDLVVASGGDGTVTSILYAMRYTNIPVLPFPAGTANLLVGNIDSPTEPHALALLAKRCETLDFDMGEVSFSVDGAIETHGFGIIAGAGFDATIMENAQSRKAALGENAYFLAALANPAPTVSHFVIDLDGTKIESDGIGILLVNFGKMQFDIAVTHGNDPRDGLLEVAILKSHNTAQVIPVFLSALLDRDGRFPSRADGLEVHYAREVHISADPPLTIQYDGEPTHVTTPFSARALSRAVRIVVDKDSEIIQAYANGLS